jgi:F0F1-type ATP synthase assembly protein I
MWKYKKFSLLNLYFLILNIVIFIFIKFSYSYKHATIVFLAGTIVLISSFVYTCILNINKNVLTPKYIIRNFYFANLLKICLILLLCVFLVDYWISMPALFFCFLLLFNFIYWIGCFFYGDVMIYERK